MYIFGTGGEDVPDESPLIKSNLVSLVSRHVRQSRCLPVLIVYAMSISNIEFVLEITSDIINHGIAQTVGV